MPWQLFVSEVIMLRLSSQIQCHCGIDLLDMPLDVNWIKLIFFFFFFKENNYRTDDDIKMFKREVSLARLRAVTKGDFALHDALY